MGTKIVLLQKNAFNKLDAEEQALEDYILRNVKDVKIHHTSTRKVNNKSYPGDIYFASGCIDFMHAVYKHQNITPPEINDYPETFSKYYLRGIKKAKVWELTEDMFPAFIKPADKLKNFTGTIIRSLWDLKTLRLKRDAVVWVSEVINIDLENRVMFNNGKWVDQGNFDRPLEVYADFMTFMENVMCTIAEAGMRIGTFDVGYCLRTNRFFIVEFNQLYSLGLYNHIPKDFYAETVIKNYRKLKGAIYEQI